MRREQGPGPQAASTTADFAARSGATIKALRVYQRRGLPNPARSPVIGDLWSHVIGRVIADAVPLLVMSMSMARQ